MPENLYTTSSVVSVSYGSTMAGLFRHAEGENAVSYATLDRASTAVANMPDNVRRTLLAPIEQETVNPQKAYYVVDDLGMGGAGGKSIVISAEDYMRLISSVPSRSAQSRWVIGDEDDNITIPPRLLNALDLMGSGLYASIKKENSMTGRISTTHFGNNENNGDPENGMLPRFGRYTKRHRKFLVVSFFVLLGVTVIAATAVIVLHRILPLLPEEPLEQESTTPSIITTYKYLPGIITERNGFEYIHYNKEQKWSIARKNCVLWGGDLVSIQSEEENNFVNSLHQENCNKEKCPNGKCTPLSPCNRYDYWVWLGLNDNSEEGSFFWSDGTINQFTAWDTSVKPQQPNNGGGADQTAENCVVQSDFDGQWYDDQCKGPYQSICKRRKL